jgi:hypothetical protein
MVDLQRAVTVKQAAVDELIKRPGVTAVDVGYKYVNGARTDTVAIRVSVAEKKAASKLTKAEKVPSDIDGVPTDVIQRVFEPFAGDGEPTNKVKLVDIEPQVYTTRHRPLVGGISVGPCRAIGGYIFTGTAGAIVKDNATGDPMLLSNFHVMCVDDGWSVGDDMAQPSRVDGGSCPADYVGELTRATLSSAVDGAVARIDGVAYSCEVVDIGKVAGTKAATLGMAVRKHGRTTALTYGTVDSLSLTVNIDYGDGIGVQTLTNQIGIAPDTAQNAHFSEKGDSGSVIMADDRKVVGLLFAGSSDGYTIANQISNVLSELNVTMCTAPTFTLPPKVIKDLSDSKSKEFKVEVKDRKELKAEIKERKELKTEKIEKIEKPEFEKTPREKVRDLPPIDQPPIDRPPIERPPITGPTIDDRLSALEAAVSALSTFVAQSQRPDLSAGAYINEEDLSEEDLEAIRRYAQDQGWM